MINNSWDIILKPFLESEEFHKLIAFVNKEYNTKIIYPLKKISLMH